MRVVRSIWGLCRCEGPLPGCYLGKEILKTRDKMKYKCIKFKPLLVEGGMFPGGENMTVWVSDDQNRIPVLVEAQILVGKVKAIISEMEGIRNELNSLMDD